MGAITYNGNSIQTANIITTDINVGSPRINIGKHVIANANRSKYDTPDHPERTIRISGQFVADTISAADILEDTIRGIFVGENNNLDIEYAGSTRRYLTTPSVVNISRPGGLMYGDFSVVFDCPVPYGRDVTLTQLATATGNTLANLTIPVTIGGSAEEQYPIITVLINSGSGLAAKTMSIGNGLNGQTLNVNRVWMAGDTLTLDPFNQLVTVGGAEVAFTGSIPLYNKGSASVTYGDTFTTRNVDITISQYKYWM